MLESPLQNLSSPPHSSSQIMGDLKVAISLLTETGDKLSGALNHNYLLSDPQGRLFIWRTPKNSPEAVVPINHEYTSLGFVPLGGGFRIRSIQEQAAFIYQLNRLNISTPVPMFVTESGMLLPFMEGTSLDKYLRQGNVDAATKSLDNLTLAHKVGVVFGDRWAKNSIVTPDSNLVEIDFDVELIGRNTFEFELTQTLYHLLHFSSKRQEILTILEGYFRLTQLALGYDVELVNHFLLKHVEFFKEAGYEGISGGIKSEVSELTEIIKETQ